MVIDPYFAAIPVKCCSKWRVKGVKCTLCRWNSTFPRVYFCLMLCSDIFPGTLTLCMFHTTLPSLPRFNSPALSLQIRVQGDVENEIFGMQPAVILQTPAALTPTHTLLPVQYSLLIHTHTHDRFVCWWMFVWLGAHFLSLRMPVW